MPDESARPNPDELLARLQTEEQRQARGKLKVFLGYAAGVGKSYAMLDAARQRQVEGVDVVIGYVETHGRAETEALLKGLPIIPRREVQHRGVTLYEMDLDAVLERRPQLALVDELAHTNAPGSRHPKRYSDVEELLAAGIDVYTTLNIQHLESVTDVVAQITGAVVRETLPDRVLDQADSIELLDLPPAELLQRLREGKVYVPEQASRAAQMFFRMGNLTALRELSLRRAAERVDNQMRDYMQARAIPGPWPAGDRLLVCISPSALSERLVRATRGLADHLRAEWFAVYVETPAHLRAPQGKREQVMRLLHLAEELGGRSVTLPGRSVAATVVAYARQHNITKIVAGKPLRPRWLDLLRGSVVDDLIDHSGDIDVYVISGSDAAAATSDSALRSWMPRRPWRRYALGLGLVLLATLISVPVQFFVSPSNLVMIYLAAVVIAALYLGRGPAAFTALAGVLALDFFFVPPRFLFTVQDTEYLLTFAGLFIVGLIVSSLASQVREQGEASEGREIQARALYELSRDLAVAGDVVAIVQVVIRHVCESFGRDTVILLPEAGHLRPTAPDTKVGLDESDLALATWAFEHGQPAGRGTDTLPAARMRYLPLKTARGVLGILGVCPAGPAQYLSPGQRGLLDAFAIVAALAIERAQLAEAARRTQILETTEKLQSALLSSISHDLRTPLVTITGALATLGEDAALLKEDERQSLIETAHEEAERLNRLVSNLLDMSRIEAGALRVAREPCDVQDMVGSALAQLGQRLDTRPVRVDAPPDLPLVPADFVLIVHVLVNLIDNALKYSPASGAIDISARPAGDSVEIAVADRGTGIPTADLERIFDKFYRVQRPEVVAGTGLGLSISKGIVEAHGGRIWAGNRPEGGAVITISLPAERRASETPESTT